MEPVVDLLVLESAPGAARDLLRGLTAQGFTVDEATSLGSARDLFLARGGHALLIIGPGIATGLARRVIDALRCVDDQLPIVVFGDEPIRGVDLPNLHRIPCFHPGSRAGIGAIQKVICQIR